MGPPNAPVPTESAQQELEAYTQMLPGLAAVTEQQMPGMAQAVQNTAAQVDPQQAQLAAQLFQQYAPQLASMGSQVNQQTQQAQAASNLANIQGVGGQSAEALNALNQQINPQYAALENSAGNSLNQIIQSQNPTALSGSQEAAVERGLNQTNNSAGNLNNGSAIGTVNNAMTFGNALTAKQGALEQAINSAVPLMGASQNNFASTATPSSPANPGLGQFAGVNNSLSSGLSPIASGAQGQASSIVQQQNAINANLPSLLSTIGQGVGIANGALGSSGGGSSGVMGAASSAGCLFIVTEAYSGIPIPPWVRQWREYHYYKSPTMRKGYLQTCKVIVPLMKRFLFIRILVWKLMVGPMTAYGGYLCKISGYNYAKKYHWYARFWCNLWRIIGFILR